MVNKQKVKKKPINIHL